MQLVTKAFNLVMACNRTGIVRQIDQATRLLTLKSHRFFFFYLALHCSALFSAWHQCTLQLDAGRVLVAPTKTPIPCNATPLGIPICRTNWDFGVDISSLGHEAWRRLQEIAMEQ